MSEMDLPVLHPDHFADMSSPDAGGRVGLANGEPPAITMATFEGSDGVTQAVVLEFFDFHLRRLEPIEISRVLDTSGRWVKGHDDLCRWETTMTTGRFVRHRWIVDVRYELRVEPHGDGVGADGKVRIPADWFQVSSPFTDAVWQFITDLGEVDISRARSLLELRAERPEWVDSQVLDAGTRDFGLAVREEGPFDVEPISTLTDRSYPCADVAAEYAHRREARLAVEQDRLAEATATVRTAYAEDRQTETSQPYEQLVRNDREEAEWRLSMLQLLFDGDRAPDFEALVAHDRSHNRSAFGDTDVLDDAVVEALGTVDRPGDPLRVRIRMLVDLLIAQLGPLSMRVGTLSATDGRTVAQDEALTEAMEHLGRLGRRIVWAQELLAWADTEYNAPVEPDLIARTEAALASAFVSDVSVRLRYEPNAFRGGSPWRVLIEDADGAVDIEVPFASGGRLDAAALVAWLQTTHGLTIEPDDAAFDPLTPADATTRDDLRVENGVVVWEFTGYAYSPPPPLDDVLPDVFPPDPEPAADAPSPTSEQASALVRHWKKILAGTAVGAGLLGGALFGLGGGGGDQDTVAAGGTDETEPGVVEDEVLDESVDENAVPGDADAAGEPDVATPEAEDAGDAEASGSDDTPDSDGGAVDSDEGEDSGSEEDVSTDDDREQAAVIEIPDAPIGDLAAAGSFLIAETTTEITFADPGVGGGDMPVDLVGVSSIAFTLPSDVDDATDFLFGGAAAPPAEDEVYRIEQASVGFRFDGFPASNVFYEGRQQLLFTTAELRFPPATMLPSVGEFVNASGELEVGLWYADGRFVPLDRSDGINRPGDGSEDTITAMKWNPDTAVASTEKLLVQTSADSGIPTVFGSPHHVATWTSGGRYYVGFVTENPLAEMTVALSYADDPQDPSTYRFRQATPTQTVQLPWEGVEAAAADYRAAMG